MTPSTEPKPHTGRIWGYMLVGLVMVVVIVGAIVELNPPRQTPDVEQISAEACEVALVDMGLSRDPLSLLSNPPGMNHDVKKDFDGILAIRKSCAESKDRMALVMSYMTTERLKIMMEQMAESQKLFIQIAEQNADCIVRELKEHPEKAALLQNPK